MGLRLPNEKMKTSFNNFILMDFDLFMSSLQMKCILIQLKRLGYVRERRIAAADFDVVAVPLSAGCEPEPEPERGSIH